MVDRIGNFLSPSQNSQVQAIKQTQRVADDVQQQLASGKRVNSALDDPQNFFTAQSLQNRSNDLARLLDGIGQGIRTIETANTGLNAIENLLDQADALLTEAELELYGDRDVAEPTIVPNSVADFATYVPGQDVGGTITLQDDNTTITFDGNLWKQIPISYEITEDTVLRFDYRSTNIPEISAIGFDDDNDWLNNNERFFLYGTQTTAVPYSAPTPTFEYSGSGEFETIEIPIGQYFTGNFANLHIIHDDDGGGDDGDATFRGITLFESGETTFSSDREERAQQYENDFRDILDQIDAITEDTSYRGINLLRDEDLVTDFNEERSNTLITEGLDATSNGLGLEFEDFRFLSRLTSSQDRVRTAIDTIRSYRGSIASNLSIITTRQDFTQNTISTLKSGSDDLIVGDANENGAELLATQVRQSIQFSVLSLTQASIADFL